MSKRFVARPFSLFSSVAAMAVVAFGGSMLNAAEVESTAEAQNAMEASANADTVDTTLDTSLDTTPMDREQSRVHWGFNLGGSYQTRSDVDGGGDFSVNRFSTSGGAVLMLSDNLVLNFNLGFERHEFRFSSITRMGGEPWENINIASAQVALGLHLNENWSFYGTPLVSFAAEDSADLVDAFTGGFAVGFNYQVDDKFNIGFGLGVMSQLEDSVSVFPIIRFNWEIADQWTLRTGSFTLGVQGGAGIELEFRPIENLAVAAGAQYHVRRFRLDDEQIAPEGVGEERGLPVYLRVTWMACDNFTVSGFGGVVLGGRLELNDEDGDKITEKSYDPAMVFGARIAVNF